MRLERPSLEASMAEPRDTSIPNEQPRRTPAEGSRENVNTDEESGITNRPIEEEQREQQDLPPRGDRKDGAHA
jgi:hypothetical protein